MTGRARLVEGKGCTERELLERTDGVLLPGVRGTVLGAVSGRAKGVGAFTLGLVDDTWCSLLCRFVNVTGRATAWGLLRATAG